MITKPSNWDSVQAFSDRPKLPVGAYVCKVKQAVVQHSDFGEQLCLLFDITEGEYAGFYQDEFETNQMKDKKWKGVLRQFLPKDDGSQKDEWTKSSFKGMVTAFENSNPGFVWDWSEKSFVGKEVGIIFRNEEWDYNGKTGWAVRPFRAIAIANVQNGTYTLPQNKPLKNKAADSFGAAPTAADDFAIIADDTDLPF